MAIFDLFSKRARASRGETPDVYQYEDLSEELRVQIVHIMVDALGNHEAYQSKTTEYMKLIHDALCREYGIFSLVDSNSRIGGIDYNKDVYNYFLAEANLERALDVIELGFRVIDTICRGYSFYNSSSPRITPDDAINELNERFRYHGFGYQFDSGTLIKVDDQIIHREAVKPALQALREKGFEGANEEFLKAFEHYRHGRNKEALNEALKAFESTMKIICESNQWKFKPKDTASKLIDCCMDNGLIPDYLKSHYTSLAAGLKSGVPTVRNKEGGHGQGTIPKGVPVYLVSYHLHLTAASILMMVEANKALD